MVLDHFVIHIDDDPAILDALKSRLGTHGVPFEPGWGKGTKGFKAANIWIGRQYFEIMRILRPDGGGWVPHWVERHHQGRRGLYCIFLKTGRLNEIAENLRATDIAIKGPERIIYRALLGLLKKSMPWRVLYLPPVPGTDLEFGFIEYDPGLEAQLKSHMVPNADENGITGISDARLCLPLSDEARSFLLRLFPGAKGTANGMTVSLAEGSIHIENAGHVHAHFHAKSEDAGRKTGAVTLENVTLHL